MVVRNVKGTGERTCSCGSWLMHWQRFAGVKAIYCGVFECVNPAELGAHVVKDAEADGAECIVPMCKYHNALTEVLHPLARHVMMMTANVSKTCGASKI